VRRQVANRRDSRLTRLLSAAAHKRPIRENSLNSLKGKSDSKKVVEPHLKPIYGAVQESTILSTSPEAANHTETQPLLGHRN
jgi:hypothetical protein